MQANVQRHAVSGSVNLGAALRAASNSLGLSLHDLESPFCKLEAASTIGPRAAAGSYDAAVAAIAKYPKFGSPSMRNPLNR